MSTITATVTGPEDGMVIYKWSSMTGGSVGSAMPWGSYADKTVQYFGTFGDTLTMQGSNDGTNWFTLTNNLGNTITPTAAGASLITEAPQYVRPNCGASISNITVIVVANKS